MAAVVGLLAVLGCGDDSTGPGNLPGNPYVGIYSLVTVDGATLPFTRPTGPNTSITYNLGLLQLRANETYVVALSTWETVGGVTTSIHLDFTGAYDRAGSEIDLFHPQGETIQVTASSATHLTMEFAGVTLVFTR